MVRPRRSATISAVSRARASGLETIKLILGVGTPLIGRLAHVETLGFEVRIMKLRRDPKCPICGDAPTIKGLIDYEEFCGLRPPSSGGAGTGRNAA